jgi:hypothetical protein
VQQQKSITNPASYELTPSNAGQASRLVREGKANLEIVEYPWGVELAVASPCSSLKELEGGESLEV